MCYAGGGSTWTENPGVRGEASGGETVSEKVSIILPQAVGANLIVSSKALESWTGHTAVHVFEG